MGSEVGVVEVNGGSRLVLKLVTESAEMVSHVSAVCKSETDIETDDSVL